MRTEAPTQSGGPRVHLVRFMNHCVTQLMYNALAAR